MKLSLSSIRGRRFINCWHTGAKTPTYRENCAQEFACGYMNSSENLTVNAAFQGFDPWKVQHESNVQDHYKIETRENQVSWERTCSGNDGGLVGVYQDLNVDVSCAHKLVLEFDVLVQYHTLANTGWWSERYGGSGEMPAKVSITYLGIDEKHYVWDHGFLTGCVERPTFGLSLPPGDRGKVVMATTLRNFTIAEAGTWQHFSFDLMNPETLKDARGQALPRPVRLKRLHLHGSGWDFKAAMANIFLSF